jgi:hypothetical protein
MALNLRQQARKDSASPHLPIFQYDPLDYARGTIRLLSILPNLSKDGLVQCQLRHGSVNSTYACLSYVWGTESSQHDILINGRVAKIRKNLRSFIEVARKKHGISSRMFWIDALCIDQESTKEKNHQVAQMGLIYSNAVEVVSWLGHSRAISSAFAGYVGAKPDPRYDFLRDWLEVISNQYWKRSWITQEILLARRLILWVNDFEVDSRKLRDMHRSLGSLNPTRKELPPDEWHPDVSLFSTLLAAMTGRSDLRNQSLVNLFHRLPSRESQRPRDRIYSLLSIASDAALIPVDYGSSDVDVFLDVLGALSKSMCVCFWSFMVETMEYQAHSSSKPGSVHRAPILELPIRVADTEFFRAPDLADWHDMCSTCRTRLPDVDPDRRGHLFCLKKFCECCKAGMHFYLRRYRTRDGERYTVQRVTSHSVNTERDVLNVRVDHTSADAFDFSALSIDDEVSMPLFRISLTADMLMYLLHQDTGPNTPPVSRQLCRDSREEKGRLIYHNPRPKSTAGQLPVDVRKPSLLSGLARSTKRMQH